MDELGFKRWLFNRKIDKKIQSDIVSRLKAIQRELGNCDLDIEYKKDKCEHIVNALSHKGENEYMESYGVVKLPIGKYSLSTYRYALNMYLRFLEE